MAKHCKYGKVKGRNKCRKAPKRRASRKGSRKGCRTVKGGGCLCGRKFAKRSRCK